MSSSPRFCIGLVTSQPEKLRDYFPTRDEPNFVPTEPPFAPDDQFLVNELRRHGHRVLPIIWGCDAAGLVNAVDRLVVRSPWDYIDSDAQRERFLGWIANLEQAGIAVDNHPRLMTWLMDKRYLKDLEATGVPVVPSQVVAQGEATDLLDVFDAVGRLIVKPCVSAAGVGLVYLEARSAVAAFQREFVASCRKQAYLVQPFVPEIQTAGEWSLVYLGGTCSHAVHKCPAPGQVLVHAERGGSVRFAEPPAPVRALGELVLERLPEAFTIHHGAHDSSVPFPPLYLRVDVIESAAGPVVSECEGVEPELFFRARPGSEGLFRQLLEDRIKR